MNDAFKLFVLLNKISFDIWKTSWYEYISKNLLHVLNMF